VAKRVFKIPCAGNEIPVKPPLFIHDARSSEYDVDLLLVLEDFHCRTNSSGRPQIVGVQPGENLAVAELPATVDGVEGSPIRLGQPADPVAVPFEDIERSVRGTAVHNDAFQMGVILRKDALQCGRKIASVVLTRDDN